MNISQTLKQARKAAGLTQSELAEKAGVSHGAIVNYENGRRTNISANILFAIADALNVFPDDLLNDSEYENSNDVDIYTLIDEILKEKHMNRRQLAIAADIPEASLASAFRRKSPSFPIERLNKIASVLNVPVQSFFDALNDNQPTEDQALHDLIKIYNRLNDIGQQRILAYANDIMRIDEYRK